MYYDSVEFYLWAKESWQSLPNNTRGCKISEDCGSYFYEIIWSTMQKGIRINESQLAHLASKARQENTIRGYLHKKSADTGKWQLRWFALYQNLLFYYENDSSNRASGVALLEGCYCERLVTPTSTSKGKEGDKQVRSSFLLTHWPLGDLDVILKLQVSVLFYWLVS